MKKKLISILLTSVMTVGLLSACGSAHTDDNTKKFLKQTQQKLSLTYPGQIPVLLPSL